MLKQTLRSIRESAGKTQQDAADALGITKQAYGRKESGLRLLKAGEARILAELFSVSPDEILRAETVTKLVTEPGGDTGQ